MGLSERIGGFYAKIEEGFYGFMDSLADKGIPVYSVIDPVEERGLPFLPIAAAALLFIVFLGYGLVFLSSPSTEVRLSITDKTGEPLGGVTLKALDSSGKEIKLDSDLFSDSAQFTVPLGKGGRITLQASKQGFKTATANVYLSADIVDAGIRLEKDVKLLEGRLRLVDNDTGDAVEGAKVAARLADNASAECIEGADGTYTCPGVGEGVPTRIIVSQPNYEDKELETRFASDSVSEVGLVPKASAASGKTSIVVRAFDDATKNRIGNFTLRIYDAKSNELISEATETDNDGEQIEKIAKGTSARIVVEKKDYLIYDSSAAGENTTLREDEVIRQVFLKAGTNTLTVGVVDAAGTPVSQVQVNLFSASGEMLSQKSTALAGEAVFEGLGTAQIYYASAWGDGYLPARASANLAQLNRVTLVYTRAVANNSGALTVYTVDERNLAVNGATLNFFLDANGGVVPLGLPPQETDVTGQFEMLAPLNANIIVRAVKEGLEGEESVKILQTFRNDAVVKLLQPNSNILLKVLNDSGKEMQGGTVTVFGGKDVILEEGYKAGGVVFNAGAYGYVNVRYSGDDGKSFEEQVYVKDLNSVSISPKGANSNGTTPTIEFMGVYSVDGVKAAGISKGNDYFLQFRAVYPEGSASNGMHIRLGSDSVAFADSQDAGILGYSAVGAAAFYGRSYNSVPKPGFEAQDFENSGAEGRYNKFIELYFTTGGEKVVKVRVKAKETSKDAETEVHYRAWSMVAGMKYRNPTDTSLGLEEYGNGRTSLYADTLAEKVKILETSSSCANDLCASYKFVRSDGSEYSVDNFRASLGELYALEVGLSPSAAKKVTVKASTAKLKPKIGFQGYGVDNFSEFPDTNSADTSIEAENVVLDSREATGVRLYFKALDVENSSIVLQLISGETIINEQFRFSVYREKNISFRTIPAAPSYGQDFVMLLQDEQKNPIENAQIRLTKANGAELLTITGDGSSKRGANGRYSVKNSFDAGTVKYEARAPNYRLLQGTIEITKAGIMEFSAPETYIQIAKGKQASDTQLELRNKSKQPIDQQVSFDVEPIGTLPEGFSIKVTPISTLQANASQRIMVTAEYSGPKDTAHGEARITARGRTQQGFTVSAEAKVIADYNPTIPADCVEFSKNGIVVYVASGMDDRSFYDRQYNRTYANSGTGTVDTTNRLGQTDPSAYYRYSGFAAGSQETFTAKLGQKAQCQVNLDLKPEVIVRGQKDEGIQVDSGAIKLSPQLSSVQANRTDTQEISVNVANKMLRNYPGKQSFKYDIVYKGEGFEKSLPVEVIVWNPRYALQVSRNIELYLGPDQTGRYGAQVPLFVRNIGEADIENVQFRVSSATSGGNVQIQVLPDFPIQFLKKGNSIDPPQTLVASVTRNEKTTLVDQKVLDITGVIDGATFSFGPVNVISHISAAQCITAVPSNVSFVSTQSTQGALEQLITIRNTCAEESRILGVSQPAGIGLNRLFLYPMDAFLGPGQEAQFALRLEKKQDYSGPVQPIYVHAFLPRSGTPIDSNPIIADIKLGKNVAKGTAATEEITMDVCEGGKKNVRMPLIASGNSPLCDTSYCDAVQLANFLATRIEGKIRDAERQVQNRSAEIQKTDCSQFDLARGFCTFDGLGVKNETFYVYLSQDNLSPEILNKALDGTNGTSRSFRAQFFQGTSGGEYLGGYSKQIFLNNNIRGCGAYAIKLNGTVAVQGNRIVPDLMNIVVDVVHDASDPAKQATEQCLARIQNVGNFLPRDEGLTKSTKYNTWMGVVQAQDQSLEPLAADVAKGLFGSDQRSVTGDFSTNTLLLNLGSTEGYITRLEMDKTASDGPVKVRALIRESLDAENKLQKEIAAESGQALKNLKDLALNGCIGEDESYMLIKSAKDLGRANIVVKDKLNVQYNAETCQEFRVTSNLKQQINLTARKETNFDGLKDEPYFKKKPEGLNAAAKGTITSISTDKLDPKTNTYDVNVLICVEGNSQFAQTQGKKLEIQGKPAEATGKSAKIQNVPIELQVCGIHPLAFLEKSKTLAPTKNKDDYYYATFVWKGEPEAINFADLVKLGDVEQKTKTAESFIKDPKGTKIKDTSEVVEAKRKAAGIYFGVCGATSVVTSLARPLVGWGLAVVNLFADCGIPYTALLGETNDTVKSVMDFMNNTFLEPLKKGLDAVTSLFSVPFKFILNGLGIGSNSGLELAKNLQPGSLNESGTVLTAFADEALIKNAIVSMQITLGGNLTNDTLWSTKSASDFAKNASQTRQVAQNVADQMTERIGKDMFGISWEDVKKEPLATAASDSRKVALRKMNQRFDQKAEQGLYKYLTGSTDFTFKEFGVTKRVTVDEAAEYLFKNSVPEMRTELLKSPEFLTAVSDVRAGKFKISEGIDPTKDALDNVIDASKVRTEAIDELTKNLNTKNVITQVGGTTPIADMSIGPTSADEAAIEGKIGTQLDAIKANIKKRWASIKGIDSGVVDNETVNDILDNTLSAKKFNIEYTPAGGLGGARPTPNTIYKGSIPASEIERAAINAEEQFITALKSGKIEALDIQLNKKIATATADKAMELGKGGTDIRAAKLSIVKPKTWLPLAKNFLKEGLFGVLANSAGMLAYDIALEKFLSNAQGTAKIVNREIQDSAQVAFLGQAFAPLDPTTTSILKYRTYRITVTTNSSSGAKEMKIGYVSSIPPDADAKKWVLNDCVNPGFDEGASSVLPGLVPEVQNVNKFPKPFRENSELQLYHVRGAESYLKKQASGERFGAMISSAVKSARDANPSFETSTGLNLEALVTSIGVYKSNLGSEQDNPQFRGLFMFGCDRKTTPTTSDVSSNAYCAAKKIVQFSGTACSSTPKDTGCYFTAYEKDPANESGGRFRVDEKEFKQIYEAWDGYKWIPQTR